METTPSTKHPSVADGLVGPMRRQLKLKLTEQLIADPMLEQDWFHMRISARLLIGVINWNLCNI
ncbi:unnamed protein product [Darwinula stevensoni]|uniref:Uncharacterized protein n=1 Tax=Darwinula stevensoni TaxID=69355 RepID=A0A7R9FQK7_9CRUS|nr:unnamed protein product [Darwinula stevensoni]CAG0899611.1 unnamed protein product [Darwinula stevensoni]